MVILLTNDKYSHKFIIERETFIYNMKRQELEKKAHLLNIKEEEEEDLCEYLKETEENAVISP